MSSAHPSSEAVRVAVVGLGYWGPNLVRALHDVSAAVPVAICDLDPEALAAVRRRYPGLAATTSFDEVIDNPEVDAVVIATPGASHHPLAAAALEAGKHVFVEKPLALSSQDCRDLIARAERCERLVMPGHTFLYSPPVNLIHDLIHTGALGEIYFVSTSRVNLGLHQPNASVVWDLAPHDFSILLYLLDEAPTQVAALSRSCIIESTPDVAFINMWFPSGAVAHAELSWLAPSKLRRTAIVGSEKMVVYDDTSNEPVRIFDAGVDLPNPDSFGAYQLSYRTGDIISPRVSAMEPLVLELDDFCTAIRDGSPTRSSAALGLTVVEMIEAVDRSLDAGGTPQAVRAGVAAPS
jgi:predicted dehydrogenase